MIRSKQHNGYAIALAWPQTYCKQPGAWYDGLMDRLRFSKNNYYKVGHAAVVLIDIKTTKCHYFDFGRYHSPFQYGRARGATTDSDLKMKTEPKFDIGNNKIENYTEILNELQNNKACHGEGALHASYCSINFEKAYSEAIKMQNNIFIPYGPFRINGSNCSRFVNTIISAGKPKFNILLKLKYKLPLTPTPIGNVSALNHNRIVPNPIGKLIFTPKKKLEKKLLQSTLIEPIRHKSIPNNSQWLSGEGAGSWFSVSSHEDGIKLKRYSPDGKLECSSLLRNPFIRYSDLDEFIVTYPSNCSVLTLIHRNKKITFKNFKSRTIINDISNKKSSTSSAIAVNC